VLAVLWYLATTRWKVSPLLLPNPLRVLGDFWDILKTGEFLGDLRVTLTELALAFAISASCGIAAGYLISRTQYRIRVFEPLFSAIYAVPIIRSCRSTCCFSGWARLQDRARRDHQLLSDRLSTVRASATSTRCW